MSNGNKHETHLVIDVISSLNVPKMLDLQIIHVDKMIKRKFHFFFCVEYRLLSHLNLCSFVSRKKVPATEVCLSRQNHNYRFELWHVISNNVAF